MKQVSIVMKEKKFDELVEYMTKLEEALHFYANRKNFQKLEVPNWPQINFYGNQFMYVSPDDGQRARDALGL